MADEPKWINPLNNTINISVLTKILPKKGNLVYEYNPFRNYRLSNDYYEYQNQYYTEDQLRDTFGIEYDKNTDHWVNTATRNPIEKQMEKQINVRKKGELVDFITDELSFDLAHPVTMIPQYSYDGSVNLILTDGKNQPKIINSRFSALGKDTYEIVDRSGSNDTNIYDQGDQFEVDTSLYKIVKRIPKLKLVDINSGGNLKCGNYHFYFKLADADGNETDFIAESGLVSIFIGEHYPQSVYTGNRDENSVKQVIFKLSNVDPAYSYVHVYYSRYSAEDGENRVIHYKQINKDYTVDHFQESTILITGFEQTYDVTKEDINLFYNIIDSAKAATTAKSMLFLGNVHKPALPCEKLKDLSLRFLPYLKDKKYELSMDQEYVISSKSRGYYDPLYIYDNVGYWNKELYRLGIVYIMSNGQLSRVFNIRGRTQLAVFNEGSDKTYIDHQYTNFEIGEEIKYNESTGLIMSKGTNTANENVKGVIQLNSEDDTNVVHALEIRVSNEVIDELKKLGVQGYFFVRQNRIPLILAQGITIGIDKVGRVPTIPTKGGVLSDLASELNGSTYVETKDINGINFISEGFLSRYSFDLKPKGGFFGLIGKLAICAGLLAGIVAGAVFTCGAGSAVFGGMISGFIGGVGTGAATAVGLTGVAATVCTVGVAAGLGAAAGAAAGAVVGTTVGVVDSAIKGISRAANPIKLEGRKTKIPNGYKRVETDDSRLLGKTFEDRIIIKDNTCNEVGAILCPDYDVQPQYYNQLITGGEFVLKTSNSQALINHYSIKEKTSSKVEQGYFFSNDSRHFYISQQQYSNVNTVQTYSARLQAIPDNISCATIGKIKFRSKAGDGAEAWRYEFIGEDFNHIASTNTAETKEKDDDTEKSQEEVTADLSSKKVKEEIAQKEVNSDIVRGSYGPYIGMIDYPGQSAETVSIMIPGYSDTLFNEYVKIRMNDVDPYHTISDRFDINDLSDYYAVKSNLKGDSKGSHDLIMEVNRGDCYICQFTHRLNRNFNDESHPYNSDIVDASSWKSHYKIEKSEEFSKINVGDVNAVNLGMWVTFTVRSNKNLNVRSLDGSVVEETAMMGHPRGFYPHDGMIAEGSYKSPEALVYNDGFSKNLSERINVGLIDTPYNDFDRDWFGTRIMYSNVHINNAYKNGFRVFKGTAFKDYTRQYGSITKLLNYGDDLFVIFEHGLALIPIQERAIAAQGSGGMAYINTDEILPDTPNIISESYGSTWADSVIITPQDGETSIAIFGIDTYAKKIWMYSGGALTILSSLYVQEFLNKNITLSERDKDPILGIRNVKTTYNAFKHDVMFTFYDDLIGTEEKVWNLCYNIPLKKFITFYSWVPSFMANINNIPFSFNRNVSKWIAKLGQTHAENSFSEGIILSSNIYNITEDSIISTGGLYFDLEKKGSKNELQKYKLYATKSTSDSVKNYSLIGVFNLKDYIVPEGEDIEYYVQYELLPDIYGYYKDFKIEGVHIASVESNESSTIFDPREIKKILGNRKIYGLYLLNDSKNKYLSELYYRNKAGHTYNDYDDYKVTAKEIDPEHCKLTKEINSEHGKLVEDIEITLNNYFDEVKNLPIFHSRDGGRPNLASPINKHNLVQLLNVKATIYAKYSGSTTNKDERYTASLFDYLKSKEGGNEASLTSEGWINAGEYESSIAVSSKWNLQFLSSDFWKHGQAGIIDKAEDIKPTMWYGEQHPFEFEVVVHDEVQTHKIFQNIELIANKAQPESFHFEIIGECYDFHKDKPNMYFRQEARKALFQYNGCDISYDANFRKINPKQQPRSAELIHNYFDRQDTLEDVYDTYNLKDANKQLYYPQYMAWANQSPDKDYRHLSGAEIVYYPNRQEYRIWQHQPAINIDDLPQDSSSSLIRGNCRYLEDRWRITINPILVCYKNEYVKKNPGVLCQPKNSTWPNAMNAEYKKSEAKLPPITIKNTCLPKAVVNFVSKNNNNIIFPDESNNIGKNNALYGLYSWEGYCPIDNTNWLNDISIYGTDFGEAQNRKEIDLKDKFIKIRIRYSGEELAVIDFLNTIYTVSYA